jgi:hypothetical protein
MTRWSRLRAALDNLAHKGRAEADLDEEVRECAEMLADAKRAVRNLLHALEIPRPWNSPSPIAFKISRSSVPCKRFVWLSPNPNSYRKTI